MKRFILRFVGPGPKPVEDVRRVCRVPGVRVTDESSSRMLLVEAPEEALRSVVRALPDWTFAEEATVPLPDPRRKVRAAAK